MPDTFDPVKSTHFPSYGKMSPFEKRELKRRKVKEKLNNAKANPDLELRFNLANDIGPIPDIVDSHRREECKHSLKLHLETYHPNKFSLVWSKDHLDLIKTTESAILTDSGLYAFACFRGFGKTSIAESAAEWALLHGWKRYFVIIAATGSLAKDITAGMLQEFETNDRLLEDFPEVCHPIRCLERNFMRAIGQHIDGEATRIQYKKETFILPTVRDSLSSGSKIQAIGITGSIRGLKHTLVSGEVIRPDFVMIDDPQTDKSAASAAMVSRREKIINGAILGLAGPRQSITAVMPCTVIQSNDLAEKFLDKKAKPEWRGKRTKLLPSFPKRMDLWRKYADVRAECLRNDLGLGGATEFYKVNQTDMDEGAEASWSERFDPRFQISAIQSAMDLYFTDPTAFFSEYQNDPLRTGDDLQNNELELKLEDLLSRCNGLRYGIVPRDTLYLTTGIDIQGKILYYLTVAWKEDFGGSIVDYGTYPGQPGYDGWTASNPPVPLQAIHSDLQFGPLVFTALDRIKDDILTKAFLVDEVGSRKYVEKCLIDANWSMSGDAVYEFCKQNEQQNIYIPCHGRSISASMIPMEQWAKKQMEKRYDKCRILPQTVQNNRGRHATYDGNYWKSIIAERLLVPKGGTGALMLYGDNPYHHQIMLQHFCIEKPVRKKGRGREVDEWTTESSTVENHFWDCLIQSAVAANIAGLRPHVKTVEETNGEVKTTVSTKRGRKVADPPPINRSVTR